MKLIQKAGFKNFYLPTDNSKFIVFSADTANAEFDFEKAFSSYAFNFLLIFHKNANVQVNNTLRDTLLTKVSSGRKIYWIDELGISDINSCPSITITSINQATQYTNIVFGKDKFKVFLKNTNPAGQVFNSTVIFDNTKSVLAFTVNNSKKHRMVANTENENEYNSFIIPLAHQQNVFGFDSKATNNNVGSICFLSLPSSKKSIQPTTALLSPNSQNVNILFNYKYFIDESYNQNVDLIAIIYPSLNFDNKDTNYQSFIELFVREDLSTCFIDEFGNNFKISKGSSLINRIAFVNPDSANPISRNFFFMPIAGETLDLQSNGKFLLLGNSGTERQQKPEQLIFHETSDVLFGEDDKGRVVANEYGGSLTSFPVNIKNGLRYYIDSEKTPFFDNRDKTKTKNNQARETDYTPIEVGKISEYRIVPIIPTMSFKDNLELENIEKYLVKLRLGNASTSSIQRSSYISPQGFLKQGNTLSFIKGPKIDGILKSSLNHDQHRFLISDADIDIQLSISKEDVFFVTTPALLEDVKFRANFDIFFSIHGFNIDLILNNLQTQEINDNQRIIIFKYSRYTVEELLADTSKWSNYGKFRTTDWANPAP